jgi:hypothetical protein
MDNIPAITRKAFVLMVEAAGVELTNLRVFGNLQVLKGGEFR